MEKKQIYLFVFSAALLTVSCGSGSNSDTSVTANRSGAATRAHWQAERKPVVIETDTILSESIGVSMLLRDATADEFMALQSSCFERKGKVYRSNDYNALTSDTAAVAGICYPVHRGIKANGAIELRTPFSENLFGRETGREFGTETCIRMQWRSGMALLRIVTESDDVRDRLESLAVSGDHIYSCGVYMPYTGEWCDRKSEYGIDAPNADCLLNNGRQHDFFLIPTDTACLMTVRAVINGKAKMLRKTIPPMLVGSLTELHLKATDADFVVSSSWVESNRKLYIPNMKDVVKDSVKVGHYLRADGFVTSVRDAKTVAVVYQTDGKHGKAVALADCEGRYVFTNSDLPKGREFPTIDGSRREGVLNPGPNEDVADAYKIIWTPKMPYNEKCAIGCTDGAALTHSLVVRSRNVDGLRGLKHEAMLTEAERHPGAYVPSLGELVRLYYMVKQRKVELPELIPLEGEYLTSCENGNYYYMIDFSTGIIASTLSKQYGAAQLRLFYQF